MTGTLNWIKGKPKEEGVYFVYAPSAHEGKPFYGSAWWSAKNVRWESLPAVWAHGVTHYAVPTSPEQSSAGRRDVILEIAEMEFVYYRGYAACPSCKVIANELPGEFPHRSDCLWVWCSEQVEERDIKLDAACMGCKRIHPHYNFKPEQLCYTLWCENCGTRMHALVEDERTGSDPV